MNSATGCDSEKLCSEELRTVAGGNWACLFTFVSSNYDRIATPPGFWFFHMCKPSLSWISSKNSSIILRTLKVLRLLP